MSSSRADKAVTHMARFLSLRVSKHLVEKKLDVTK
jgi:hypothetical protein